MFNFFLLAAVNCDSCLTCSQPLLEPVPLLLLLLTALMAGHANLQLPLLVSLKPLYTSLVCNIACLQSLLFIYCNASTSASLFFCSSYQSRRVHVQLLFPCCSRLWLRPDLLISNRCWNLCPCSCCLAGHATLQLPLPVSLNPFQTSLV